ncbi:glycosyltransferase family 4 protein [Roseibacillus ishigakijimensis]|uniref:Glycosyltransferase family 4 protein n=1 Tax=Roseibacillus ishigakijimensis TaxID=454146 RepID=A0A934RQ55_9BACT|nr:glycosyltransferase family 4 protein [Roseibacillus ishigakijimensis]MBK1833428.1 glycosyltransferase family 4 protein [Roseibacillus ishigakijimensis]
MARRKRGAVVVAGQMPPPVGGQNLNVQRVYQLLRKEEEGPVRHWRFNFTKDSANFSSVGLDKVLELVRVVGRLLRLRLEGAIDVIIYPVGGPHLAPVLRDALLLPWAYLFSRRVFLHFRAAGLKEYLESCPRWLAQVARSIYQRADRAIVLSQFGSRDAEAAGLKDCFVMPNGLEDTLGEGSGQSLRSSSETRTIALSVGHLCHEKGTPELLRAFGQIQGDYPDLELHLVGEPARDLTHTDLENLRAECSDPDRVKFRGLLKGEALAEAYRNAHLFVFSTVAPYESFGMVAIEAMHWSLPIVATDWRANREVCGEGEGVVFAEGVEEDLTGGLTTALLKALAAKEQWPQWGRANRKRYEDLYSIEKLRVRLRELLA